MKLGEKTRPFHLFPILMPDLLSRSRLIEHAKSKGVALTFHYVPLHSSPGGVKFGRSVGDYSNTERISNTLVRLPLFSDMTIDEASRVVEVLLEFEIKE